MLESHYTKLSYCYLVEKAFWVQMLNTAEWNRNSNEFWWFYVIHVQSIKFGKKFASSLVSVNNIELLITLSFQEVKQHEW